MSPGIELTSSMTTPEIITATKDVILALAGGVTACVAVIGLTTWSRQLHGTTKFEVARGLAKATYKLRDEIRSYRSPIIRAGEFPDEYRNFGGVKDPDTEANAYAHVYTARLQPIVSALQEFDTQTLEAEAIWGEKIRERTDSIRRLVIKLNAATEAFIANEKSGGEDFKQNRQFGIQIRSEVSASRSDSENAFTIEVVAAVSAIEDELKPHLKRG